jgi:hypothetical protein
MLSKPDSLRCRLGTWPMLASRVTTPSSLEQRSTSRLASTSSCREPLARVAWIKRHQVDVLDQPLAPEWMSVASGEGNHPGVDVQRPARCDPLAQPIRSSAAHRTSKHRLRPIFCPSGHSEPDSDRPDRPTVCVSRPSIPKIVPSNAQGCRREERGCAQAGRVTLGGQRWRPVESVSADSGTACSAQDEYIAVRLIQLS